MAPRHAGIVTLAEKGGKLQGIFTDLGSVERISNEEKVGAITTMLLQLSFVPDTKGILENIEIMKNMKEIK